MKNKFTLLPVYISSTHTLNIDYCTGCAFSFVGKGVGKFYFYYPLSYLYMIDLLKTIKIKLAFNFNTKN